MRRAVEREVRRSPKDPTKWRDKRAGRSVGVEVILRAARRPQLPKAGDLAKLSASLSEILAGS
jgi:hypothetical protein